jgi:large subunit ribosomal protein L9
MKVILKETIETLGIIGSEVKVADGYARNYLLPQGKAVESSPRNHKILEQEKANVEIQIAKERNLAEETAEMLKGVTCSIAAKVAEEDQLYGSVTTHDIFNSLKDQDVIIERRMILLPEPIKSIGTYKIPIRVYKGVEPEITVEVVPESK